MTPGEVLSFALFSDYVSDGLGLEPDVVVSEARLVEDLGLDSFDLVELLTLVEELGVRFPDDVAIRLETMGDVHKEYSERAQRSRRQA